MIAGESGFFTTAFPVKGGKRCCGALRAKRTGQEMGAVYMPAPQTGTPMTYALNGKQYIVLAISGAGHSGELIAFKLPD